MAAKTVLNYLPRKSVVHDLTGTTKLAFFLLFTSFFKYSAAKVCIVFGNSKTFRVIITTNLLTKKLIAKIWLLIKLYLPLHSISSVNL